MEANTSTSSLDQSKSNESSFVSGSDMEEDKEGSSPPKDLKALMEKWKVVMKGAECWVCYMRNVFFTCGTCERSYHRKCAFMGNGFPLPEFDQPIDVVKKVDDPTKVKMIKCSECMIAENSRVAGFEGLTPKQLKPVLVYIAKKVAIFETDYEKAKLKEETARNVNPEDAFKLKTVKEKASNGAYKTIEGFFADIKQLLFDVVKYYGRESECYLIAREILKVANKELADAVRCECYRRGIDENGKPLLKSAHAPLMRESCKLPHLLVWVKDKRYPYWPAKVLTCSNPDKKKFIVRVRWFEDAILSEIQLEERNIMIYSEKAPTKYSTTPSIRTRLKNALADCTEYIVNARKKFGNVCIADEAVVFDGNLSAARETMFPDVSEAVNVSVN